MELKNKGLVFGEHMLGEMVMHKMYGKGEIIGFDKEDLRVLVEFEEYDIAVEKIRPEISLIGNTRYIIMRGYSDVESVWCKNNDIKKIKIKYVYINVEIYPIDFDDKYLDNTYRVISVSKNPKYEEIDATEVQGLYIPEGFASEYRSIKVTKEVI